MKYSPTMNPILLWIHVAKPQGPYRGIAPIELRSTWTKPDSEEDMTVIVTNLEVIHPHQGSNTPVEFPGREGVNPGNITKRCTEQVVLDRQLCEKIDQETGNQYRLGGSVF